MKTGVLLMSAVMLLACVQYSSQQDGDNKAIADTQGWQDEFQPEEYRGEKEEDNTEEPQRRPRGKRRRRMRKRLRPQQLEDVDRVSDADQNPDGTYDRPLPEDEGVTPAEFPRRRPLKRRRRPYRRYQDEEGVPVKPLRRRRKGGRKKIRPENPDDAIPTEIPQDQMKNEQPLDLETTTQGLRTTPSTTPSPTPPEEVSPTMITKIIVPTGPSFKEDDQLDNKVISNSVKPENEDNSGVFGSKIFDRKKLFSSPRRALPVTSAVIRKLGPSVKGNSTETLGAIKEKSNEKRIENTLIKTNYLIDTTTNFPDQIKSEKLVNHENKTQKLQLPNNEDEEPNYPKIAPRPVFVRTKKPDIETTTYATTEVIESTSKREKQQENSTVKKTEMTEIEFEKDEPMQTKSEEEKLKLNKTMTESEFEKMIDNLDLDTFNLTLLDDYILDLLKTKSGKERLSTILESRNMTIPQLLEHRERGSSKFHLFEMFPQKKKNEGNQSTTTTTEKQEINKEVKEIQFPSEDVMGSFHNFVTEEIAKHKQSIENKIADTEPEGTMTRENREPRVFDSMPEFTTLSVTSTTKDGKHPTWRVIPNPKLRPVSVRGNYQEIPISQVLNRPLENNVNDIYIVDERESLIHHKKYGLSSLDPKKGKDSFTNFRKIPVSVKSAIIISGIILAVATFGFLSLLISCRVRQKRSIKRAKQDMMCEHLQNEDFMTSQQSLSPVLTKHQQAYAHVQQQHHSHPHNRHYYLWRTIRRTFRYD